jgi:hypothetical protein
VVKLSREPGAERQRRLAQQEGLEGMTRALARLFTEAAR